MDQMASRKDSGLCVSTNPPGATELPRPYTSKKSDISAVGSDFQFRRDPSTSDLYTVRDILSVNKLRAVNEDAFNEEASPVLRRLVVESVGRPLWEYRSDKELLVGFRAALEGHEFLWKQGILHRGISAGNVLLGDSEGVQGFITDVEYTHVREIHLTEMWTELAASVGRARGTQTTPAHRERRTFDDAAMPERGQAMTGTLQFMALGLLEAIIAGIPIEHRVEHDLESFIWVLGYSVQRKLLKDYPEKTLKHEKLSLEFKAEFGKLKVNLIASARMKPLSFIDALGVDEVPSPFVVAFLFEYKEMLTNRKAKRIKALLPPTSSYSNPVTTSRAPAFTYAALFDILDHYISIIPPS
ncbi:hypothetical protein FA95DRAFT_330622 [Auriscalpium vulgare]|uniref:Uncharacterized protein n=1 Tax=Auriscalpium vulgare TaxID=40419 RepID=A0ACB8RJH6_9AGAM|nr:hypothetical protein FA95DRAFT_330622 [Auriscalpium vulgare]